MKTHSFGRYCTPQFRPPWRTRGGAVVNRVYVPPAHACSLPSRTGKTEQALDALAAARRSGFVAIIVEDGRFNGVGAFRDIA